MWVVFKIPLSSAYYLELNHFGCMFSCERQKCNVNRSPVQCHLFVKVHVKGKQDAHPYRREGRKKCPNESFVCHLTWLDQTGWEDVWYSACGDVEHAIWRHRGSVLPSVEMNGHQHNPLNAHVSSKWERRRDVAPLVWKNKSVWTRCCPDRRRRLRLITVGYPLVAAAWRRARGPPVASCCCGWGCGSG